MVYSTLTQVKYYLPEIAQGDLSYDPELTDLQSNVVLEIDNKVSQYTPLPVQDTYVKSSLGYIEAELVAATFRMRRPPVIDNKEANARIQEMQDHAWTRFDQLMKTNYNRLSKFVGQPRTVGNTYPISTLGGQLGL